MAVIVIEDWMIEEEGLKGLDLLAFALIHGCTQKGDGCWHGGYDRLSKRIGGKQRGTIDAINRLVKDGKIVKFDATIDGRQVKAFRSALNADAENADAGSADAENAEREQKEDSNNSSLFPNIGDIDNNIKNNNNISPKGKEKCERKGEEKIKQDVEKLYSIYPAKCPVRDSYTHKSEKCKAKIKSLLTKHKAEELEAIMRRYVDETYGKHYLKDFMSFLNNLPDYSEVSSGPKKEIPSWAKEGERYSFSFFMDHERELHIIGEDLRKHVLRGGAIEWVDGEWTKIG